MAEDRDTEARWYVVHTYSGYENKVAQNLETIVENRRLQELIHEVKVPVELVPDIKDGKEREVERKLFPGYVLVKMVMTDDSWYIVRNTRGVTGFVGPSSKPIPLTDEGAVLSEKAANLMGVSAGDEIFLVADSGEQLPVKVAAITENYAFHYL